MSKIKFVATKGAKGQWISSNNIPKNSVDTYYAVTLCQTESKFNILSNEYWRYCNGAWQYYYDGEWRTSWNPLFKVVAYQEIQDLESAPYQEFH